MQQLLTGKTRFPEFRGSPRESRRWDQLTSEVTCRNRTGMNTDRLMGVSNRNGVHPMRKNVQGGGLSRCKVIEPLDFAYNPMRINVGSIAQWDGEGDALISGDYVAFRAKPNVTDPWFLRFIVESSPWDKIVQKSGSGGVRVRLYYSDLANYRITIPKLEEQRAIADLLRSQDHETNLEQLRLEQLQQQKKALMQQLLTGKVRVKA